MARLPADRGGQKWQPQKARLLRRAPPGRDLRSLRERRRRVLRSQQGSLPARESLSGSPRIPRREVGAPQKLCRGGLPQGGRVLERVMNSIRNGLGMRETEIAWEPSRPRNPHFYA